MVITWEGSEEDAQTLVQSISPDDSTAFDFEIITIGDVAILTITVTDDSLRTLRATVDDILACLSAAESSINELN